MAIDSALGRLGIKQGVCASSTRPTNPFEGQVIYESDTNRTLVYDNAAWVVVADNQVLSIDAANSRVGIGTTTPTVALQVDSGSTDQFAAPQIYVAPSGHASSDRAAIQLDDIQLLTDIAGDGTEDFSIYSNNAAAHRLSIDGSGNVGIGTYSPVMPIDFNAPGTDGARMRFEDGTTQTSGIQFTANGSAVNYNTQPFFGKEGLNDSDPVGIWHSGSWRMVVNSSGNVGIGTTSPGSMLDVRGGVQTHRILPFSDGTYDLGANVLRWRDVYATNGTIQTSDERDKASITDIDLGLAFVNDLRPVTYTWDDRSGNVGARTHMGFVAQEVATVLGDEASNRAVWIHASAEQTTDPETGEVDEGRDIQGLRYNELMAPMVKAIQELSATVQTLTARIEALEAGS